MRTELLECALSLSKCAFCWASTGAVPSLSKGSARIYFDKLNPHYRGCVAARSAVQSPTPSSARMIA